MLKRKLCAALLAAAMTTGVFAASASAESSASSVTFNFAKLELTEPPLHMNNRIYVPYTDFVSTIGAEASWDEATGTVTITGEKFAWKAGVLEPLESRGEVEVVVTMGSTTAYLNGEAHELDAAPVVLNGKPTVPLRFVAEAFEYWVEWNQTTRRASLLPSLTFNEGNELVTLTNRPKRIVSFSDRDTEIIYAAGGTLVGIASAPGEIVPEAALDLPQVGTPDNIDFDKLAALKPDLIIGVPEMAEHAATFKEMGAEFVAVDYVRLGFGYKVSLPNLIYKYMYIFNSYSSDQTGKMFEEMYARAQTITPAKAIFFLESPDNPGVFTLPSQGHYLGTLISQARGVSFTYTFDGYSLYTMEDVGLYVNMDMNSFLPNNPQIIFLVSPDEPDAAIDKFRKYLVDQMKQLQTSMENTYGGDWSSAFPVDRIEPFVERTVVLPYDRFGENPGLGLIDLIGEMMDHIEKVPSEE